MKGYIVTTVLLAAILAAAGCGEDQDLANPADSPYEPIINPSDFTASTKVDNQYFPLVPGKVMVYKGGDERNEVEVLTETHLVMGIACVVVRDRVWDKGELIEDTYDWYAQDNYGNVWYMGEDASELEKGRVVTKAGSWEAAVNGARPGIIMLARPLAGLWYRTEYYKGEAEDLAQVLAIKETVTVPYGTFKDCLKILELNALEPGVEEHKYYAPGVGMVKEMAIRGGSGMAVLVEIRSGQ
jgi:hypothetical protein